jgi:hypothetical protein
MNKGPMKNYVSPYERREQWIWKLITSRPGVCANIAGHSKEDIEWFRDWCNWLLKKKNDDLRVELFCNELAALLDPRRVAVPA